jgi:hypothetical protein
MNEHFIAKPDRCWLGATLIQTMPSPFSPQCSFPGNVTVGYKVYGSQLLRLFVFAYLHALNLRSARSKYNPS